MRIICFVFAALLLAGPVCAQNPMAKVKDLKKKAAAAAETAVAQTGDIAYKAAREAFNKTAKDIPFPYNSAELNLSDPKVTIAGVNVDTFMRNTLIPALTKLVGLLPADKQVTVTGHASKRGTEEPSGTFQGNIALSKARAEALVKYITANSSLPAERFRVAAAGSSQPLPDADPASEKNCRVSMMLE